MEKILGRSNLKHTYYYRLVTTLFNTTYFHKRFLEVGAVKEKRRDMKVMYSQVGVSLAHKRVKPSWS
jgi:hypothetical protein